MPPRTIRIGGATGFWGDSWTGAEQLVREGNVDFLVFDYLAELTMSILASARQKNPDLGYAEDFASVTMQDLLEEIVERGIRVVSNAGGLNPNACAAAVRKIAAAKGIDVKIAVVTGDDVLEKTRTLHAAGSSALVLSSPLPEKLTTANAYLGAVPIRKALDEGAQIVITGRCVDSAVTLGALMHSFGWSETDYDRLAGGSIAGHLIECGCQATGGIHTDWQSVEGWDNVGFPIVEVRADGSFLLSKPEGTGGLVSVPVGTEQLLYEVGDPVNYVLPDVICDLSKVTVSEVRKDCVEISGVRGKPPTSTYKVSSTYHGGYRITLRLTVIGQDAALKAQRMGEAILARSRRLFVKYGLSDFDEVDVAVIGAEAAYGAHARVSSPREVILHIAALHQDRRALKYFARESSGAAVAMAPGVTSGGAGRGQASASIRQYTYLIDKDQVEPVVTIGDQSWNVQAQPGNQRTAGTSVPASVCDALPVGAPAPTEAGVPLIELAYGRSGDKGDTSNIAIIARSAEAFAFLQRELTAERVANYMQHYVLGSVTRFDLPLVHALNFVCNRALGGGGMASLRHDPLGKGMAQILLSMPMQGAERLSSRVRPAA